MSHRSQMNQNFRTATSKFATICCPKSEGCCQKKRRSSQKSIDRKLSDWKAIERKSSGRKSLDQKSSGKKSISRKSVDPEDPDRKSSMGRDSLARSSLGRASRQSRDSNAGTSLGRDSNARASGGRASNPRASGGRDSNAGPPEQKFSIARPSQIRRGTTQGSQQELLTNAYMLEKEQCNTNHPEERRMCCCMKESGKIAATNGNAHTDPDGSSGIRRTILSFFGRRSPSTKSKSTKSTRSSPSTKSTGPVESDGSIKSNSRVTKDEDIPEPSISEPSIQEIEFPSQGYIETQSKKKQALRQKRVASYDHDLYERRTPKTRHVPHVPLHRPEYLRPKAQKGQPQQPQTKKKKHPAIRNRNKTAPPDEVPMMMSKTPTGENDSYNMNQSDESTSSDDDYDMPVYHPVDVLRHRRGWSERLGGTRRSGRR